MSNVPRTRIVAACVIMITMCIILILVILLFLMGTQKNGHVLVNGRKEREEEWNSTEERDEENNETEDIQSVFGGEASAKNTGLYGT